jgi:hypothetical protein
METEMNLIRIRAANLSRAQTIAQAMGLLIDEIYGDKSKEHVNVAARKSGSRGNHEPRWTDEQRNEFANWKL